MTKLSQDRIKLLSEAAGLGLNFRLSAERAGVSAETYRAWRRRGERDIAAGIQSEHAELVESAGQARGSLAYEMATVLKNAGLSGPPRIRIAAAERLLKLIGAFEAEPAPQPFESSQADQRGEMDNRISKLPVPVLERLCELENQKVAIMEEAERHLEFGLRG